MRSTQKDMRRQTVLTTLTPIPIATDGDGIFSDGTPWHSRKTATGQFDLFFDQRVVPVGGSVGGISAGAAFYVFEKVEPGYVRVQCFNQAGTAVDKTFDVTMTCLDTRT